MQKFNILVIVSFAVHIALHSGVNAVPVDMPEEKMTKFEFSPHYVKDLEIGGPLSDYGSRLGLKAVVTDSGAPEDPDFISHNSFLNTAIYSSSPPIIGTLGQLYMWFKTTNEGNKENLIESAVSRSLYFRGWGWTEVDRHPMIPTLAIVFNLTRDIFLSYAEITNKSRDYLNLSPFVVFKRDKERIGEVIFPFGEQAEYTISTTEMDSHGLICMDFIGKGPDQESISVLIRPNLGVLKVKCSNDDCNEGLSIQLKKTHLEKDGSINIYLLIGLCNGSNKEDMRKIILDLATSMEEASYSQQDLLRDKTDEWQEFFEGTPFPHTEEPRLKNLYKMAITGLRMAQYGDGMLVNKVAQAEISSREGMWAIRAIWEWDPKMAKEVLDNILKSQADDGCIPARIPLDLQEQTLAEWAMPLLPWILDDIPGGLSSLDKDYLGWVYSRLKMQSSFFGKRHFSSDDRLIGFSPVDTDTWIDSPRFPCLSTPEACSHGSTSIAAVDLNSWQYIGYVSLASMSDIIENGEGDELRRKALSLARAIEELLWNSETNSYADLISSEGGTYHSDVITPVFLWPLFAGITSDPERIRGAIENYILDPEHFLGGKGDGNWPLPSVSFSHPSYNSGGGGRLWQGQAWLDIAYIAITTLYRYGYGEEAGSLRDRVLKMIYEADPGGIHLSFDPVNKTVGWDTSLEGDPVSPPSIFQRASACAIVVLLLLDRYQRVRTLMPEEAGVKGYFRKLFDLSSGELIYSLSTNGMTIPYSELSTRDKLPFSEATESLSLKLADPYNNIKGNALEVHLPLYPRASVWEVGHGDSRKRLEVKKWNGGIAFNARLTNTDTGIEQYVIELKPDEKGGCECSHFGHDYEGDDGGTVDILLVVLYLSILYVIRSLSHWVIH